MTNLKNTKQSYGVIAMIIHWLFALGVFGLFGLGLYMVELTYYDTWYKGSLDLHKSLGVVMLVLLVLRVVWRVLNISPEAIAAPKWQQLGASFAHFLLYLLPLALMFSGYLISTADGRAIEVFELVAIPALPALIDNQEDAAGLIHEILAWLTIGIALIHAIAALKHHVMDKDQTLNRMIGRNKSI